MKRVIVVGAGPAGSATAMVLGAAGGVEVLLLDRRQFPRTKVCASGLSPWTLACLDELGVGAAVRREAHRIDGALIAGSAGPAVELRGHHETAVLLRERFDHLLVEEAVRRGARLREGVRVRSLLFDGKRAVGVKTSDGELEASYVVDCSGSTGKIGPPGPPGLVLHTIMGWYEGLAEGSDLVEIYFDPSVKPHYGWVFPEGPHRANVGIVYAPDSGPGARERFAAFCDHRLGERIRRASQIGNLVGHPVRTSAVPRGLGGPGWLAAGEAARLADMATAEGIFHALVSGAAAGTVLRAAVAEGLRQPDLLRPYSRLIRKKLLSRLALGRGLMEVLRTPALDVALRYRDAQTVRGFLRKAFAGLYHG